MGGRQGRGGEQPECKRVEWRCPQHTTMALSMGPRMVTPIHLPPPRDGSDHEDQFMNHCEVLRYFDDGQVCSYASSDSFLLHIHPPCFWLPFMPLCSPLITIFYCRKYSGDTE